MCGLLPGRAAALAIARAHSFTQPCHRTILAATRAVAARTIASPPAMSRGTPCTPRGHHRRAIPHARAGRRGCRRACRTLQATQDAGDKNKARRYNRETARRYALPPSAAIRATSGRPRASPPSPYAPPPLPSSKPSARCISRTCVEGRGSTIPWPRNLTKTLWAS